MRGWPAGRGGATSRGMRCLFLAVALAALSGCLRPDACTPGDDPSVELGTGENEYVPLDPDDPVYQIVHGPQGGYHSVIGLEATHLDASDLLAADLAGTLDGEPVGDSAPWVQMRCNPRTDTLQSWGSFLIWDAQPADLHGREVEIEVALTDITGTTVTDSVLATLHDPYLE